MEFRILGPLEVHARRAGGGDLTPRAAKLRVVLATLLVRANKVVSIDRLIDELWGDEPPRTAMTTLQVYVSQLRKVLQEADAEGGRKALVTRAPGYMLLLNDAQLDLVRFEELYAQGRKAMDRGDYELAAELQRSALELWRGPMLSDIPHGPLLNSTAVRLGETRISALEQRISAALHLNRHHEVVGDLQTLVTELPMHEQFHAHLMVALYRMGRQADALSTFAKLRATLVKELAIEPGIQMQQLHRRVLNGDLLLLHPSAWRAEHPENAGSLPHGAARAG
ncbi:hypothetical protein DMB38_08185 [Streptomyces sp. WAC 06738]|uniref:AfsR/SARP family transcriptional regulator n=1 Tax=Streptomyces sp. WAC 06738 TaxID=2203210 RepID=UPI000F6F9F05|nr:AfsR/SARP family transcriptional regulator [Streptomyces sp. WAC 06738]AZM45813.1 hypothetical protein DMB38_08185 [Streptomyces sp. WAC 06738]